MIDKERLKQAVIKGVNQMPSECKVYRQKLNNYKEPEGAPELITTLVGLLYKSTTTRDINIKIQDKGEVLEQQNSKFLTVYDNESSKVKTGDILTIDNKRYRVIDPGENFKVYFDMVVE
ncbi:hypothetical protein NBE98_09640 [Clostridium swellfunianum]|uniref:hypothetical protein n=1 Tax=Clostridium swellfunianum TaxID=1367462 RepID=UPI002030DA80|nr:hypothetical protein [Clostridium swellfunianum]MCM0648635.1 hypothetical protein [Clostridium swellfunianum]